MKNKKNMTPKFWMIALVIIISFGMTVIVAFQFKTLHHETATISKVQVVKRSFNIVVRSIGVLDAGQAHMVASTLRGGKGKIIYLVNDGAWVKKEEVLVKLDPAPFEEEILELKGKIKRLTAAVEAKKQLLEWGKNRVSKELSAAGFKLKRAELELLKYKNGEGPLQLIQYKEELRKIQQRKNKYLSYLDNLEVLKEKGFDHDGERFRAKQELQLVQENFKTAEMKVDSYQNYVYPSMIKKFEADLEQAKVELEQIKKGSVHQIAQAQSSLNEVQAQLENNINGLKETRKKLIKTVIKAPSNGIVILYEAFRNGQRRKPRIGDIALQNQPILYLPNISTMIVKTRVREIDLHKVTIGQECKVALEAYPGKKLLGTVVFIGALASESNANSRGAKYFQMTVKLTSPDSDLRPGMTARVSILISRVDKAVTLPVYTVFEDQDGKYCFHCQSENNCRKTRIKTGRENDDFIEILSGLSEGDWVQTVKPDSEQVF